MLTSDDVSGTKKREEKPFFLENAFQRYTRVGWRGSGHRICAFHKRSGILVVVEGDSAAQKHYKSGCDVRTLLLLQHAARYIG